MSLSQTAGRRMTQQDAQPGHGQGTAGVGSRQAGKAGRFPEPLAAIDLASENQRVACCAVYVTYWTYVTSRASPQHRASHDRSTCDSLEGSNFR